MTLQGIPLFYDVFRLLLAGIRNCPQVHAGLDDVFICAFAFALTATCPYVVYEFMNIMLIIIPECFYRIRSESNAPEFSFSFFKDQLMSQEF
jgi:hypothetical protein